MTTKNKLKYINAAKDGYGDLGVEILSLHNDVDTVLHSIEEIKDTISSIDPSVDKELNSKVENVEIEVNKLKSNVEVIEESIKNLHDNHINTGFEKLSINKEYKYDVEGRLIEEISTGDSITVTKYLYDKDTITSEIIYENGVEVGRKDYIYNSNGDIYKVRSTNGDVINIATMEYVIKDVEARLNRIESKLQIGDNSEISNINKTLEEVNIKVELLEKLLPENVTSLVEIPELIKKVELLEEKVNRSHTKYRFIVYSYENKYEIPEEVDKNSSIFLEGLLLDYGDDYTIQDGFIIFNIPLIDEFEVQCKY